MILEKRNLQTAQEWNKFYIELIASYVHPKTGNHLRSHSRAIMDLVNGSLIRPGKKIRPNFLRSTSLLYKILPTNLGGCKPTFYTIYTSHLRWNSTMRHCFYRTHPWQNAVFHNFSIQIALIQSIQDDRSTRRLSTKPVKNIPKSPIRPAVLTFAVRPVGGVFEWTLIELCSNIIENSLCLFFYLMV